MYLRYNSFLRRMSHYVYKWQKKYVCLSVTEANVCDASTMIDGTQGNIYWGQNPSIMDGANKNRRHNTLTNKEEQLQEHWDWCTALTEQWQE